MLSSAISKIYISFDGWTTKGGKRGFFGVVAHFADADGTIRDLPIALPQLTGAHTGERIAEVVGNIIDVFVVTRWNSFHDTFVRAAKLHNAVDEYAQSHIERTVGADAYARSRNNKLTKYISVLEPLKEATKRLKARGKAGRFGAIYEVIPVFEAILAVYEQLLKNHESVDYNANSALEDHLPINLRAAWAKLNAYYTKLDESPAYFAATCLHLYYKNYCENS
ncbi:hypothetical protein PtrV1_04037 [Pyrenophora tritici-repentis]|uniref:Uncharacterized protein n=1 Tax=Pyrenophora tritici-repentis TaxID=45151 RepID=A0A317AL16_9PLEO|nr:hypothetical protein PtrV1_04037 [Pyrenophora tritici-repentis]KAF7451717.1 hypothetical protein A1F99_034940 [Pyrenophora tritici-repentis]KAF7566025.1 hypothetical protein PtrM4_054590 [Pyrenophora tritici-repentis]KAF7575170.1 hypothetical protein PtrM4_067940 [Pyrenophora tritici-repentis]KAI1515086.1 hypothetical protein Ptr86124_006409 [Pyrenophora tritici-repentis]